MQPLSCFPTRRKSGWSGTAVPGTWRLLYKHSDAHRPNVSRQISLVLSECEIGMQKDAHCGDFELVASASEKDWEEGIVRCFGLAYQGDTD